MNKPQKRTIVRMFLEGHCISYISASYSYEVSMDWIEQTIREAFMWPRAKLQKVIFSKRKG